MSAAASSWVRHDINDGVRRGIVFEVLVRRRTRAAVSGGATVPNDASTGVALPWGLRPSPCAATCRRYRR